MGRYAEPLIHAHQLPALVNHVEVFIAEARLAHRSSADPHDIEEEQSMTVLVSFDPTPQERQHCRMFAASLMAAVPTFEQAPGECDVSDWIVKAINKRASAHVYMVVSLPAFSREIKEAMVAAVRSLRDAQHQEIYLVIAIAQTPSDWDDFEGVDGFVAGRDHRGVAALEMFKMVCSLIAPGLMHPIDADDLSHVIGSANAPAQFAEAVWLTHTMQLQLSSPERLSRQISGRCLPHGPCTSPSLEPG